MAGPFDFLAQAPHGFEDWSSEPLDAAGNPTVRRRDVSNPRVILHDYGRLPEGGLRRGGHNPYHLIIGQDGRLIQAWRPEQRAPHAHLSNSAYGIGYAAPVGSEPSAQARETMAWLAQNLPRDWTYETHGEAFERTRGGPEQASATYRGPEEARRWVGLFRGGPQPPPAAPLPLQVRALTAGMTPPPQPAPVPANPVPAPAAPVPAAPVPAPAPPPMAPAPAPAPAVPPPALPPPPAPLLGAPPPAPAPPAPPTGGDSIMGRVGGALSGLSGFGGAQPGAAPAANPGQDALAQQQQTLSQILMRLLRGQSPTGFRDGGRVAAALRIAARDTNVAPTEKQKKAGNYAKGRVRFAGLDIAIENPKGSERSGVSKGGKSWRCRLPAHYGYFSRTEGSDGDHVDCYIGDRPDNETVWIIDQVDAETGRFDETKAMLCFKTRQDAISVYKRAFSDGKGADRIGAVTEMSIDEFKNWLKSPTRTKRPAGMKGYANGGAVRMQAVVLARAYANGRGWQ